MNPFAIFKRKPEPKAIIQTRASSKAQREAEQEYRDKHAKLARECNRPNPLRETGYQGRGQ